jgi:hypothetical protein
MSGILCVRHYWYGSICVEFGVPGQNLPVMMIIMFYKDHVNFCLHHHPCALIKLQCEDNTL